MYPVLIKKIPDQLVNAAVSSLLGLPADAGEMFIDENTCQLIRDSKKDDPGPLKKLLVPLHKIALFVSGFKLSYKEIKYIKDSKDKPDVFDSLDFTNLKAIHWQRICNYVLLRDSLKINNDLLIDFFLTGKNDLLSIACNWPKKDLELIIAEFGFAGNALKNEKALIVITKCMEMINRTGLAAEVLISWAKADAVLNFDTCFDLSLTIKELVKAKYEDDEWLEVAKKLTDSLRENQRQALVTFLCNKLDMDEGELTEKFLIDVSVCACMDASQIKLAIGSIHLFVNQCLLNQRSKIEGGKEKGVAAKAINKRNWDGYMHSVVLWEAYRKVIIHASDYLDPKWLFEMSPIFKKCRSEMTQGDITNESATNVFKLYARELHEVANLKILSVFQEITTTGFLLYVIGRTKAAPYKYHFRTCDHLLNCSAWESIPIQIKNNDDGVNSGEHVMILRHQDRSLLFMLEFNEQVQSDNEEGFSKNATELSTVPLNKTSGTKYWEIRLAWSELKGDKWSEKRISNETINRPQNESTTTKMTATFRMQTDLIVRNFVKSVNGNDSADAVERRPLRLNNYFTKVALNTNSIEFNLINENGDGVGKFGFDMFTSTASVITRSIQIQEGAYLKQNQFYQSVNNYGKLTVHQNDYLLATKNHYRTFSPLINDIEALDYHFIYHDKDRSYLVLSENFTHYKSVPLEEEPTTMLAKFRNTTAAESVIVRSRHNDTQEVFNGINHIIVNNP